MTFGKGEIENITVGKGSGGCSTNSHMTVGEEGGGLEGKGEGCLAKAPLGLATGQV